MTEPSCRPPLPADLVGDPGALALLAPVARARGEVAVALVRLTGAADADWSSVAADRFRTQLDAAAADLRALLRELDAFEAAVASFRRESLRALVLVRAQVAAELREAPSAGAPRAGAGGA